jgi:hypothetical protein
MPKSVGLMFRPEMAKALWTGIKVQTRRAVNPSTVTVLGYRWRKGPLWDALRFAEGEVRKHNAIFGPTVSDPHLSVPWCHPEDEPTKSEDCGWYRIRPLLEPGDLVWVRENVQAIERHDGTDMVHYPACGTRADIENTEEASERWLALYHYARDGGKLPTQKGSDFGRWHRYDLIGRVVPSMLMPRWVSRMTLKITEARIERLQDISEADAVAEGCRTVEEYRLLWDVINGKGAWDINPWVVVYGFDVIRTNINDLPKEAS